MIKKIIICILSIAVISLSLLLYYEKEDKRYISKVTEKDNISMLKIVGEDTEIIKQVPQTGQWVMSYTCDDENAELYWNEKKRTVVAKNISATECTLIFRESDAIFRMISMYVDGEYVTELDSTKKYEMESYECTNGEELTWDTDNNEISIKPILEDTSCYVNFVEVKYLTLTETMLAAEEAISDVGISFGNTSRADGTNGLYYTSDTTRTENGEVVYYYRGAVENNYLVFGGYCWRIVRTVEDGSVRLRYGGEATQNGETYTCPQTGTAVNIGSSKYNTSYNNKSYVNYKTSDIRTTVENWYRDNIWKNGQNTKVTNLIADTPYCNDMSEITSGSSVSFGTAERLFIDFDDYEYGTISLLPQYKCEDSAYGYTVAKGDLTYPIGLLTADEGSYAGALYNINNSSYYLYTGEYYWTMSPHDFSNAMSFVFVLGNHIWRVDTTFSTAVIPVISLKNEARVSSGTGAYNDPYVINTD
ncbi:MAG: hypothetical protein IJB82_04340 [Bacilli bacterium]|nr:hypothetical protein [Bacilli bacterium]